MQQSGEIAYAGFGRHVVLSQIFSQAGSEEVLFREALRRFSDGTSTMRTGVCSELGIIRF